MKVIVDAFGGDNAPVEILKGPALAAENFRQIPLWAIRQKSKSSRRKQHRHKLNGYSRVRLDYRPSIPR